MNSECTYVVGDVIVAKGKVVDEILNETHTSNCDVIVMGYYVRGKFEEAVLGSASRRMLRRSKIPVMLVRLEKSTLTGYANFRLP